MTTSVHFSFDYNTSEKLLLYTHVGTKKTCMCIPSSLYHSWNLSYDLSSLLLKKCSHILILSVVQLVWNELYICKWVHNMSFDDWFLAAHKISPTSVCINMQVPVHVCTCANSNTQLGTRLLCSKFYLLCYAALLKNFAYYAQIMLTEIEQFPHIYSTILMHCLQICTFIRK